MFSHVFCIYPKDGGTEDPRYSDCLLPKILCKIDFAVIKKLDMNRSKA